MSDLKPASNLDPNAWYHLTEGRVDDYDKKNFGGMLQIDGKGVFYVFAADKNQYFQFVSLLPAPLPPPASSSSHGQSLGEDSTYTHAFAYMGPWWERTTREIVCASSMGGTDTLHCISNPSTTSPGATRSAPPRRPSTASSASAASRPRPTRTRRAPACSPRTAATCRSGTWPTGATTVS